ncbi:MAG: transporter substrate-binding domain-containing protein [Clostridiaceae bacterium]
MKRMQRIGRIIGIIIALLIIIMGTVGCENNSKDTSGQRLVASNYVPDDSLTGIKSSGKLIVGTNGESFPFAMIDTKGELIGYDVDIAKYLAEGLGVELELVDYDWNGLIPILIADKVDIVIADMTITAQRASNVSFSNSYFETGQSLLISRKTPGINTWQDLDKSGMIIAVQMSSSGEYAAQRLFKNVTIKSYLSVNEGGLALNSGKVDAVLMDQPWVAVWAKKNPETSYAVLDIVTKEKLGIAVKQGKPELLQYINTSIEALRDTSEYEDIFNKWFVDMKWLNEVEIK